MKDVLVVIVVSNKNEVNDLRDLILPSWKQASKSVQASLVIIDNNSKANLSQILEDDLCIDVIQNSFKKGYSYNINLALQRSREYDYFLVMNPDMKFTENNIAKMVCFMRANPICGLATCNLLNFDGGIQYNCRRWQSIKVILARRLKYFPKKEKIVRWYLMIDEGYDKQFSPDWVQGCYMFFDRQLLESLGGMDDKFILYFEDCDIAWRIHESGRKICYNPDTFVYHREHRASYSLFTNHAWIHIKSWIRFCFKRIFVYKKLFKPLLEEIVNKKMGVSG